MLKTDVRLSVKIGDLVKLVPYKWALNDHDKLGLIVDFDGLDHYRVVWQDNTVWIGLIQNDLEVIK